MPQNDSKPHSEGSKLYIIDNTYGTQNVCDLDTYNIISQQL